MCVAGLLSMLGMRKAVLGSGLAVFAVLFAAEDEAPWCSVLLIPALGTLKIGFLGFGISITLGELSSFRDVLPSELLGILYGGLTGRDTLDVEAGTGASSSVATAGSVSDVCRGVAFAFRGLVRVARGFLRGLDIPN